MQLSEYLTTIKSLPVDNHSFTAYRIHWQNIGQETLIDAIFADADFVTLNRNDLSNVDSMETFIIKVLLWGYPTLGRGNNVRNILKTDNFSKLVDILSECVNRNIDIYNVFDCIKNITGLGPSKMTKFLCFLKSKINDKEALILDRKIIEILNLRAFEDLNHLSQKSFSFSLKNYINYINTINDFASQNMVQSQQIEMFLFMFGKHLSPCKPRVSPNT